MEQTLFKVAKTSIQGHSHKKSDPPIPCQDAGTCGDLPNGFQVIIVSDGAGSSRMSHIASDFCVHTLYKLLEQTDFSSFIQAPENKETIRSLWQTLSMDLFGQTRKLLMEKALQESIAHGELNCTLILVIKTAWGFLSANIGDGRSGFADDQTHALHVPFMTFTAGATYFLIKDGWDKIFRSYVTIPTSISAVQYFFASTDGCQDYLMDQSGKGLKNGIYDDVLGNEAFYDYNVPYKPFFEGLIKSLNEVASDDERNLRLTALIEKGLYRLNGQETELKSISSPLLDDDKTFILFYK